ncbi:PilZ domain-containing protein [Inmirania thermothiophila]|uniref:PilZ domain-containing protein n=1 Tax=Inmirania thermothiophila TaxID=1750597 RepID=A0A3N1YBM0_9GAMM|nr:PilZ domain-containing protein [Inmirania thermothiophila]ROR34787.1 PilZ domain-containing protein [Inmirania thermothiophila]
MDRRQFYRVEDLVSLSYRVLEAEAFEEALASFERRGPVWFTLSDTLQREAEQLEAAIREVAEEHPRIAYCLELMDRKLELLGRLIAADREGLYDVPPRPAEISASGIAFANDERLEPGTLLELRIVLHPSFTAILTYGRVVRCERADGGEHPWRIAAAFEALREEDRDVIVSHVLRRQAERLRAQRQGDEGS